MTEDSKVAAYRPWFAALDPYTLVPRLGWKVTEPQKYSGPVTIAEHLAECDAKLIAVAHNGCYQFSNPLAVAEGISELVQASRNLAHAAVSVLSKGTDANVSALNKAQKKLRGILVCMGVEG